MNIGVYLILLFSLISFDSKAFEPYSGISCHNSTKNGNTDFFFKHDENFIYAKAYKRVRGSMRNGLAVVSVRRESCGGCFNSIPPQRQLEIRLRKKVIVCEHCGRILVDADLADELS